MNGFTKLFASLVTSTIWREDDKTRLVWVTMLAIADRHGEVMASVPGLAALANVGTEECRAALYVLLSPDADSRTETHEGRRIEKIDGGWVLLNYQKYRELGRSVDRAEYLRIKQRESRERKARGEAGRSTTVNPCQPPSTRINRSQKAEAEDRSDQIADPPPAAPKSPAPPHPPPDAASPVDFVTVVTKYPKSFLDVWERTGRHGSKLKGWKAWTKAKCPPWSALSVPWGLYMRSERPVAGFVKDLSTWLNERGWEQEWPPAGQRGGRPGGSTGRAEPDRAPTKEPAPPRCSHHEKSPRFRNPHPVDWCPGCREQVAREGGRMMTTEEILQPPDWMALAKGGDT